MDIQVAMGPIELVETDALLIFGFEGAPPEGIPDERVKELYDSGEFTGKALDIAVLHGPAGMKAKRLAVVGAGERAKCTPVEARKATAATGRALKSQGASPIPVSPWNRL